MILRTFIIFFLILSQAQLFSQGSIGFTDTFTDGDFTQNPTWQGEGSKFIVNASNQLQLDDNSASSPAYLSLGSEALYKGSWEFYVKLDFAPSTSNFGRVYLCSDQADLTGALNGYYLQLGGISGSADDISLYRQDGTSRNEIIDGIDGTAGTSPVEMKIRVTRDSIGNWELYTDQTATGVNYVSEGSVFDDTYASSRFFGVYCGYTSTRSDKFFFDDFAVQGELIQDTIKPVLSSLNVLSDSSIQLQFSENIAANSQAMLSNYLVDKGIGNPSASQYVSTDSSLIQLTFSNHFANGEPYQITVQNLEDFSANQMQTTSQPFLYFVPDLPAFREVVINEFYADFSPSNGLPEAEFVEIVNTSTKLFDLENWVLSDAASAISLPQFVLRPGEYVILCAASVVPDFSPYGQVLGLSSFPALNNDKDDIILKDAAGQVVDQISYTIDWYEDDSKDGGGYSIEQINPTSPCTGAFNFSASVAALGGTPGTLNSVNDVSPDQTAPLLLAAQAIAGDSIHLLFNEYIAPSSLGNLQLQFSDGNMELSQFLIAPDNQVLAVKLLNPLDSGKQIEITVSGLSDCVGNRMLESVAVLILPNAVSPYDLIINELLFNPETGGSDFVELYNRSNQIIDLQELRIANYAGDSISNIKEISSTSRLLMPGDYVVLTEDRQNIAFEYPNSNQDKLFEIKDLPSYNDDEGRVYLLSDHEVLIDYFAYSEDLHFALLDNVNGVSLERLDPNRSSQDLGNWHSASESVGFATPGYLNSQDFRNTQFSGKLEVDPELFSPDNDGFQDQVNFNYSFEAPGYVVNLTIYDDQGRIIRRLIQSQLVGPKGTFTWDGIQDDGQKARIGIYLIFLEAFNPNGDKEVLKEPCVVAGKL